MRTNMKKSVILAAAAAVILGAGQRSLFAANGNDTWVGNTSTAWSLAGNWTAGSVNKPPISGDTLIFGAAGTAGTTLNNDTTAGNGFALTFSAGASAFTIGGNSIQLNGITNSSSVLQTINTALTLAPTGAASPVTRTISGGTSVTITGTLTNNLQSNVITNSLTAGTLTLGAINLSESNTGRALTINGTGNTVINGIVANGGTGAGSLTNNGTGTITLNGSAANTYTGGTNAYNGTIVLDFANMATPTNLLASTGGLGLGNGTFKVLGKSTGTTSQTMTSVIASGNTAGNIIVDGNGGAGTSLNTTGGWIRGTQTLVNIQLLNGGTMTAAGSGAVTNGIFTTAYVTVKDAGGYGFAGVDGSNNLTRYTGGTALVDTANAANTNYAYTANGSTLNWSNGITNRSVNSLSIDTTTSGGTIDLGGASNVLTLTSKGLLMQGSNDFTIQNGQVGAANVETILHVMSGKLTIDGTVGSGTGSLTKNGAGTLVLKQTNSYTGANFIGGGTIQQGAANALGATSNATTMLAGTKIDLGGYDLAMGALASSSTSATIDNSGINAATLTVGNGNGAVTVNGSIGNTGGSLSLAKNGTGTITLAGANTYSGNTTLNAGMLVASTNTALGSGTLVINGGLVDASTAVTLTNPQVWNANFGINDSNNTTHSLTMNTGAVTLNASITIDQSGYTPLYEYGNISDGGKNYSLTITGVGNGTIGLGGNNTFGGGVNLNSGKININSANALGTGVFSIKGGSLQSNGFGALTGVSGIVISNNFSVSATGGVVNLGTAPVTVVGARTFSVDNGSFVIGGNISGTGASLTYNGTGFSGTLSLGGNNSFDGGLTVGVPGAGSPTLNLNTATALGSGPFTVNGGGTGGVILNNNSAGALTWTNNNSQFWNTNFTFTGTQSLNMGTGAVSLGSVAGATRTVTVNGNILTVGGVISNGTNATTPTINLAKAGAGTMVLSGANTFSGKVSVQAGNLSVASLNKVSGGSSSSNLGVPTDVTSGTIDIGATTNAGTLTYTGTGETTDRVINLAGTTGGVVLDQSGTGLVKYASNLTATGVGAKTLTLQGSTAGTGEIAGSIVDSSSGATSLAKTGSGTWALSGANTFTGATTITSGTLSLTNTGALASSSGITTFNTAGTLDLRSNSTGTFTIAAVNTSAGTPTINVDDLDSTTTGKTLTISGALTPRSNGSLNITGGHGYTLGLSSITLNNTATQSSTLVPTSANVTVGTVTSTGATAATLGLGGTSTGNTITGAISNGSGTVSVSATGTGMWTLSGTNTYTGATTVTNGALVFNSAGSIGGSGRTVTTTSPGVVAAGYAMDQAFVDRLVLSSTGIVALAADSSNSLSFAGFTAGTNVGPSLGAIGNATFSGTLTAASANTYNLGGGGGNLTVSTNLPANANKMNINGPGSVILTGLTNAFTGAVSINSGTLQASDNTVYGTGNQTITSTILGQAASNGVSFGGNATLQLRYNGQNDSTAQTLSLPNGKGGNLLVNTGYTATIDVDRQGGSGSNKTISFYNGTVATGSTLNVTGADGYSLAIPTLTVGTGGSAGNTTLNPTTANLSVGNATSSGTTNNHTLVLDGTSTGNTITGILANGGASSVLTVNKQDSSTWSLSGVSTYTGATNITGGTLAITGSGSINTTSGISVNGANAIFQYSSSTALSAGVTFGASGGKFIYDSSATFSQPLTVATGSTLGGHGSLGSVTVSSGGILSPGNSPGQLTVSTLLLNSGSTTHMEIGGTNLGTDYDNVTITSTNGLTYDGLLEVVSYGGYDLTQAGSYNLFTLNSGTPSGDFSSVTVGGTTLANSGGVWTGSSSGSTYQFTEASGILTVTIPEPATVSLMLGVASMGLLARRRRAR